MIERWGEGGGAHSREFRNKYSYHCALCNPVLAIKLIWKLMYDIFLLLAVSTYRALHCKLAGQH